MSYPDMMMTSPNKLIMNEDQIEEVLGEDDGEQEQLGKELAHYRLEGNWDKVKEMYHSKPKAHTITVNNSKDTALHVAVDLDEEDVVEDLVNAILVHDKSALEKKNEKGDTPLHVAASRGFGKLCRCIIGWKEERIELRTLKNKKGETPLFLAALNWHRQAFAYLHRTGEKHRIIPLLELVREDDGDSILHCAIRREHFDLAVIIVHCFPILATLRNKKEFTPLKVLATRPLAFRSGIKFSWWKLILYHCILVEPLDAEGKLKKYLKRMDYTESEEMLPKNYATLYESSRSLISVVGKLFLNLESCFKGDDEENQSKGSEKYEDGFFPPNYAVICQAIKSAYVYSVGVSGQVLSITKTKKNHQWSNQLLKALMENPYEAFTGTGGRPADLKFTIMQEINEAVNQLQNQQKDEQSSPAPMTLQKVDSKKTAKNPNNEKDSSSKKETKTHEPDDDEEKMTPFLVAAKYGIVELVEVILTKIPSAIYNTNLKNQNVLLVAVISRQPLVIEKLRKLIWNSKPQVWENMVLATDNKENTMLHLAASQPLVKDKPWGIAGSALQMMWEIKWFKYIRDTVPEHFHFRSNHDKQTAGDIFAETHKDLIKEGSDWLKETSESCSLVAALVAGVSFATTSSVPGGNGDNGEAPLAGRPAFDAFAIASLIGLCFSVTGLIMFLAILTSRKEASDFRRSLPLKLLLGLSSLFVSIVAMFVAFCSGNYFLIEHKYRTLLFPLYTATSVPVTFFAMAQFPLYVDLLIAIFKEVPRPNNKSSHF
ncbi:hypothetical protein PIB30_041875 [Stylosanthes scabra]|uniref:PGG domain-containing protein n=1 Tax=Stylosanthes scabra TaxID=79078 RepID=A0ABU6WF12_9FABA|nr:hypothetical protein [Stylosanthes scabra]